VPVIDNEPLIIPILNQSCQWTKRFVPVYGGPGYQPSQVRLQCYFPIEPALAITVHKSEGRTLEQIIIALSQSQVHGCDFSFKQLHVALSRVKFRKDIRLLLAGSNESDQWLSLNYLRDLKPDPSIKFFFAGFRDLSGPNPDEGWKDNAWCPVRANAVFRKLVAEGSVRLR
jgi:hypothetical protein